MERNSNFDEIIDRKNTGSIKFDSAEKNGMPADILPLWVADMDFKVPGAVQDALMKRAEHGVFGYTQTEDSYFEAVHDWQLSHHGFDVKKEWMVNTPGIVFALATAVKAFSKLGDNVLITRPVYYPFTRVIETNGRHAISSDLYLDENGKYRIDYADFEQKIKENDIHLFILCSPHNPISRVWTKEELTKIGEICLANDVYVVSDEIHEDFVYEGYVHTPFATISEAFANNSTTCTSPGKTFNLAGLQTSNIFIPNEEKRKAFEKEIDATGAGLLNTMGIAACEAAYRYGEEWYKGLMQHLTENVAMVRDFLQTELPEVKLIEPEGTYLLWLDFRALGLSRDELEDFIVKKAGLWLDGGIMFGDAGEGFQRVNIATGKEMLQRALLQLKKAVKELKK